MMIIHQFLVPNTKLQTNTSLILVSNEKKPMFFLFCKLGPKSACWMRQNHETRIERCSSRLRQLTVLYPASVHAKKKTQTDQWQHRNKLDSLYTQSGISTNPMIRKCVCLAGFFSLLDYIEPVPLPVLYQASSTGKTHLRTSTQLLKTDRRTEIVQQSKPSQVSGLFWNSSTNLGTVHPHMNNNYKYTTITS